MVELMTVETELEEGIFLSRLARLQRENVNIRGDYNMWRVSISDLVVRLSPFSKCSLSSMRHHKLGTNHVNYEPD